MRVEVKPVPRTEWERLSQLPSLDVPGHERLESESPGVRVDSAGTFRCELMEPRAYTVQVLERSDGRDQGYFDDGWVRWEGTIECQANGEILLPLLRLAPLVTVRGKVSSRNPLPRWICTSIRPTAEFRGPAMSSVVDHGEFVLTTKSANQYTLMVNGLESGGGEIHAIIPGDAVSQFVEILTPDFPELSPSDPIPDGWIRIRAVEGSPIDLDHQ